MAATERHQRTSSPSNSARS